MISNTKEEHFQHLKEVFEIIKKHHISVATHKCHFFKDKIDYLGQTITTEGRRPEKSYVEKLRNQSPPRDNKSLRSLMGAMQYYAKYIPKFSIRTKPWRQVEGYRTKGCKKEIHGNQLMKSNRQTNAKLSDKRYLRTS